MVSKKFWVTAFAALWLFSAIQDAEGRHRFPSRQLLVFGDSVSDIGNTYRYSFGAWPVPELYPKHCFTNKFTWVRYLQRLLRARSAKNYAYGSSTTDSFAIPGHTGPDSTWAVPGTKQLVEMYTLSQQDSPVRARRQVAVVLAGVNDVSFEYVSGGNIISESFIDSLVERLMDVARGIIAQASSARQAMLLLPNAYPPELTPWGISQVSLNEVLVQFTQMFNSKFSQAVADLKTMNCTEELKIQEVNLTDVMYGVATQGVTNRFTVEPVETQVPCIDPTTSQACTEPNQHVFFDSFHPAEWVHRLIAKEMMSIVRDYDSCE